jgi:hypothetical protein
MFATKGEDIKNLDKSGQKRGILNIIITIMVRSTYTHLITIMVRSTYTHLTRVRWLRIVNVYLIFHIFIDYVFLIFV